MGGGGPEGGEGGESSISETQHVVHMSSCHFNLRSLLLRASRFDASRRSLLFK